LRNEHSSINADEHCLSLKRVYKAREKLTAKNARDSQRAQSLNGVGTPFLHFYKKKFRSDLRCARLRKFFAEFAVEINRQTTPETRSNAFKSGMKRLRIASKKFPKKKKAFIFVHPDERFSKP
jgi:hypothetical protein